MQCIYTITTVIVKFVLLMAQVAQVTVIHITTWVTSNSYLNDIETIFGYVI